MFINHPFRENVNLRQFKAGGHFVDEGFAFISRPGQRKTGNCFSKKFTKFLIY